MVAPYPSIDPRRAKKLVAELERLAAVFIPGLRGITTEDSPGRAVVEIAGRLAGQVTQRLDKTPRRDAIAFFHTLDVPQAAPRSARAPLIFTLSDKRDKPVHAPARIQVAASTPDGEEVIFETGSALNLTPARLDYLAAVDAKADYIEEPPPQFFQLAPAAPQTKYKVVTLAGAGSDTLQITPAVGLETDDLIGINDKVYRIKTAKVGLVTLLEQDRLEQTVAANTPVHKVTRFDAFQLRDLQRHLFYVGHAELFNLEQPSAISLAVSPSAAATRLVNLGLKINIYGTKQDEEQPRWHQFKDENISARAGEILLYKDWPGSVDEVEIHQQKNRWLQIELEKLSNDAQPTDTRIAGFALRVESGKGAVQRAPGKSFCCFDEAQASDKKEETDFCIPCEVSGQEGSQTIKQAFHNAMPLPLSTRFLPFGTEPLRFDTFALAAPEALSKKGAKVALAINLVDATPAVFTLALSSSSTKHAYAIGVNGRLQVLELLDTGTLEGKILDGWKELGHPDKLPENNAGSNDIKTLQLDTSLPPQAVQVSLRKQNEQKEIFDLVVVGDQGGRFWVTKVSKKRGGSGVFTHSDWEIIPPLPNVDGARITDLVLLPFPHSPSQRIASKQTAVAPSDQSFDKLQHRYVIPYYLFVVPGAFLFAVTDQGFFSLNISPAGLPFSTWQKYSLEGYDLRLMLVKTTDELEGEGRSLVIVALVGDVDGKDLHICIFDANGDKVVDKAEKQLESGETLTALKQQLTALKSQEDEQEIIDGSSLSLEDKQEIIRKATSSAGHTPLEGNLKPSFSSDENPEAKPRLVSILSPEWPAPPDSFPFGLVLLDAESKLWHGLWDRIRLTGTVVWNPLNTDGNQALASDEVRPVAAKLTDNYFVLFAADKEKRKLFALKGTLNDSGPTSLKPDYPEGFIVQAETELICDPSVFDSTDDIKPIVLAFGKESMALWWGDVFQDVQYPERRSPAGRPSGIFVPNTNSAPLIIVNGRRETLYWSVPIQLDQDTNTNKAKFVFDNWVAESFPRADKNPELSWEYFDGDGWRRLDQDFNDTTNHLAVSGRICFRVPNDLAPTEISGQEDYWIRARLVGGDYGRAKYVVTTEVTDVPEITTQSITVDTTELSAPEILAIEACFKMIGTVEPQRVLTENNRAILDQTQANAATSAQFALFESAAAIDAKLETEEQDRALYLGFTKPYNVNPLTLFIDADEPDDPGDQLNRFELLFEVLEVEQGWRKVTADDRTDGFQHRGVINLFIDIIPQRARLFGRERFWLRVRPGKNAARWAPLLNGIYINAGEAEQARSVKQEILGSSSGEPGQRLFLSKMPVISNSLQLRVREMLSEDERLELEQAAEDRRNARQPQSDRAAKPVITNYPDISGRWVLWQQVDSFVEENGDARVYRLDPATGEVRFGNDKQGKIPPAGQDAIRAIGYQNGGGKQGNLAAFTIEGLKSSVESVENVTNPIPAAGGVDALDIDRLITTAPDRLRHRQQALTTVDIEALAVAWSSEIVQARCLPPDQTTDPIKVFIARRTGERCPQATRVERDALARYLREQGWGALGERSILVLNPDYIPLTVMVKILAESPETVAAVEKETKERLLKLLHPIDGGPDGSGWPFGRGIWKSDLFCSLADVPGMDRVDTIKLDPASLDNLPSSSLICSDEEKIKVTVDVKGGGSPS